MAFRFPSRRLSIVFLLALALLAAGGAGATSYVMVSDEALLEQAEAVLAVKVVSGEPAPDQAATDYLVEVEEVLAGFVPGSSLVVRVPGVDRSDGLSWRVWGAPSFRLEERAILFVEPRDDGTYGILHLMLGAFHRREIAGKSYAVRSLDEATEVAAPGAGHQADTGRLHRPRRWAAFNRWLADRGDGRVRPADYFAAPGEVPAAALAPRFNLIGDSVTGLAIRWFEFDTNGKVEWWANSSGQPGVPGGGFSEFREATRVWNRDGATPINLDYRGTNNASGGFADNGDGLNTILFDDPNNEISGSFNCVSGGVLAIGGPRYRRSERRTFKGREYHPTLEAEVITNDQLTCFFNRSPNASKVAEEVFGHELGHTLGLSHSCADQSSGPCNTTAKDEALMRANVHNDGRGARLNSDDLAGARLLYQIGGGGGGGTDNRPAAPSELAAVLEGRLVRLTWQDNSGNEDGFRVYRGTAGNALAALAELAAGQTAYFDQEPIPGATQLYQIGAFNGSGERRSAVVEVAIPEPEPVSVVLSPLAGSVESGMPVGFTATFSGPVERAVWRFGDDGYGFSEAACAPGTLCQEHIFSDTGLTAVSVEVIGDFGQSDSDAITVAVDPGQVGQLSEDGFVQSVIFGPRGNTGTFESNCWLHNAGNNTVLAEVEYLPRGAGNPDPQRRSITLSGGEAVFLPNVLATLFEESDNQGSLGFRYSMVATPGIPTGEPDVAAFCRSFVAVEGRVGTFGQFVGEEDGGSFSTAPKVVTGILEDGFASTLLAANLDDNPGTVTVELLDATGAAVGEPAQFVLGRRTMRFRTLPQLFPESVGRPEPFTARFTSNGIRFAASTTLLEDDSEDQIFIAARDETAAANPLYVPRVTRAASQFDAFLVSRLIARNDSAVPSRLDFELWLRGQNNSDPATASRTVPASGTLDIDDLVMSLFGLEDAVGALKVTWTNAAGAAPRLSTYAFNRSGGVGPRFGMLVDSRGEDEAAAERTVDFGAEQSAFFRADFGVVNLNDGATRIEVVLQDAEGNELARSPVQVLKAQQHLERNLEGIFPNVTIGSGSNWTVETEVVGGGPILTYLANINISGDIFFVPGKARDPVQ